MHLFPQENILLHQHLVSYYATYTEDVNSFLNFLAGRETTILESVDWELIKKILEKLKSKRGRPLVYSLIGKLKAILYCRAKGIFEATETVRELKRNKDLRKYCGFKRIPSHDVISDFLLKLEPVVEEIFEKIRDQAIKLGIIDTRRLIMDPTSIATRYLSDKDGKWGWIETKKEHYYGYGGNALFDPVTHLPVAALFTQTKKSCYEEAKALWDKRPFLPEIFLADGEFDMIKLTEEMLDLFVLPVIPYNPRNTKVPLPIEYRVQQYTNSLSIEWLDEEHKYRAEAEHAWGTLKDHFGLENVRVKGWEKVKTHFFLCLTMRLMHAIAVHKNYPGTSVRKTITVL